MRKAAIGLSILLVAGSVGAQESPKARRDYSSLLKKLLDPEQFDRLRQLELQNEGLRSITAQRESLDLKLTDEQNKAIAGVNRELKKKLNSTIQKAVADGDVKELNGKMTKLRAEADARIDALLSESQKTHWRKLVGKPFDFNKQPPADKP